MWVGGVRVILIDESGKMLLVRQRHEGKDVWMVPGGGIEDGENAVEAAVREVREETGLEIEVLSLLWHVEEVSSRGQRFVNFFSARIKGGKLALGHDPEFDDNSQVLKEVRFMTREEIKNIPILYPEYLRDEVWEKLEEKEEICLDVFRLR